MPPNMERIRRLAMSTRRIIRFVDDPFTVRERQDSSSYDKNSDTVYGVVYAAYKISNKKYVAYMQRFTQSIRSAFLGTSENVPT